MEKACELCHITLNKNSVLGDVSAFTPGGVRIGTPAMTSRGLVEADFEQVGVTRRGQLASAWQRHHVAVGLKQLGRGR